MLIVNLFYHLVATVFFKPVLYEVDENENSPLQLMLVIDKESSFNITVYISDSSITAMGNSSYVFPIISMILCCRRC